MLQADVSSIASRMPYTEGWPVLLQPFLLHYHARSLQEAVELLVELEKKQLPVLAQRIASLPLAQGRGYLWARLRAELRRHVPEVLARFPELGSWAAPLVLQRSTQVLVARGLALRIKQAPARRQAA